jgi:hypothetical protein
MGFVGMKGLMTILFRSHCPFDQLIYIALVGGARTYDIVFIENIVLNEVFHRLEAFGLKDDYASIDDMILCCLSGVHRG